MPPHKACCLLSNGPQFAHVWIFNRDVKSLAQAQSQLQFKVSFTEPSDAVNVGMTKQTEGRPQLALWLVAWSECGTTRGSSPS